ncbi:MAG: aspartate aminotransferase family protein [Anaerolineaceae bacterium]|nr:aspartate aminotransferase family protein [Anaerolineaceae bacterium]
MKSMQKSQELNDRALKVMPGQHSNLPGYDLFKPIFITHGQGAHLWDADGNEYLDFMSGLGAGIFGYGYPEMIEAVKCQMDTLYYLDAARRNPLEIDLAEKIVQHVPSAEQVRYLLSGTEACQLVIRLARAFTGRNLFLRFDGHYHGWVDNVLGGNVNTSLDEPPYGFEKEGDLFRTVGRDPLALQQSFKIPWNDIDHLESVLKKWGDQIALIIMEPVNCNGGSCWPKPGYLERVRELCDQYGIVLCFDEIITGFRMGLSGAQGVVGVTPDLTTFGKGIAGGIPFSAVAGRTDIMNLMLQRKVVGAGTFNGYPLGVASALASIKILEKDDGALYKKWDQRQARLTAGLKEIATRLGIPMLLQEVRGCIFFQFTDLPVAHNMGEWMSVSDHARQERLRAGLFEAGALILFRGRWFVNSALTEADIDKTLEMTHQVMKTI